MNSNTSLLKLIKHGFILRKDDFPDGARIRKSFMHRKQIKAIKRAYQITGVPAYEGRKGEDWDYFPMTRQGLDDAIAFAFGDNPNGMS